MLKVALATFVCDIVSYVSREEFEETSLLKLTLNTLFAIAKNIKELEFIRACFELRIALECGFMPDITACNECMEQHPQLSYLDIMNGVITCDNCRKKQSSTIVKDAFYEAGISKPISVLPISVLYALRYVFHSNDNRFLSFNLDESELALFYDTSERYLLNHLEKGFYSLDFYKSLL
jgi:DNA repair protein RecO (recombination protein O)